MREVVVVGDEHGPELVLDASSYYEALEEAHRAFPDVSLYFLGDLDEMIAQDGAGSGLDLVANARRRQSSR